MKKIVSYIVMIIIVIFMLTSCNLVTMVTGDYSGLANRNFNALITAMENKDKSAVKALFLINEEDENNVGITCLKVYNQTSDVNAEIDMEAVPIVVIGAE